MSSLIFLFRIFVGGIFVYSGLSKLTAPVENFEAVIQSYQFLSPHLIPFMAALLPWCELVLGAFLLTGFLTRFSAGMLGLCAASFIFLLVRSLLIGLPLTECGCFGAGITLAPTQAVALDSFLLIACASLVAQKHSKWSLDRWLTKS